MLLFLVAILMQVAPTTGSGAAAGVGSAAAPGAAPGAESSVAVERRDGSILRGSLGPSAAGRLEVVADGESISLSLDDVVLLETTPGAPASRLGEPAPGGAGSGAPRSGPAPDLVFLASTQGSPGTSSAAGDRLVGHLAGGDRSGLRLQLPDGPLMIIPFDRIERLLPRADRPVDRLAQLPGAGGDDRLWRRGRDDSPGNLDSLTGVLDRFEGDRLVFEGALGTLTFEASEVLAVVFAPSRAAEPAAPAGTPVIVRLAGGSRLSAGLLGIEGGAAVLGTAFAGDLRVPLASLSSLVVRGPGRSLLAELPPTAVEEWPTLGGPEDFLFPWRADLSVTGRLLEVGGVPRATGLGVHSNCKLTFAIPPGAATLRVTVGLCDEVGDLAAHGSVTCDVLVDGVRRAASGLLRGGDPPVVLRVADLEDAHELQIVTGDGGDDDSGDRVAWVDGVLLRP